MAVIKVNLDNFAEEVLRSEKPVLLDMYADWCGPCMMMAPELEAFAEENDSVKVAEAISALQVLGYTRKEIENAFNQFDTNNLTVEELIKKGLLYLSK